MTSRDVGVVESFAGYRATTTPTWRDGLRDLVWRLADFAWWLRHPEMRLCPCCRLTWQHRDWMRRFGVCHDCIDRDDGNERAE